MVRAMNYQTRYIVFARQRRIENYGSIGGGKVTVDEEGKQKIKVVEMPCEYGPFQYGLQ